MKVISDPREMQSIAEECRGAKQSIGFVPTMGALHEGHLVLCRRARQENARFCASIFVNPTQFRPGEDFNKYPRPFERDCELLQQAGCDVLFAPTPDVMYSEDSENSAFVEVAGLSTRWEGEARPGHFRGVATVVAKLFNIARPHRAYFGEKDFQQLKIIERMAHDLNFDTQVVACPTIRESDGLALSSRNIYLDVDKRAAAPALFRVLQIGRNAVAGGETQVSRLLELMYAEIKDELHIQLEYLAIVNSETLESIQEITSEKPARALIAARAGSTRLIDNIALNQRAE